MVNLPDEIKHLCRLSSEPLLIIDGKGHILSLNIPMALLLGHKTDTLLGQSLFSYTDEPVDKTKSTLSFCSHSRTPVSGMIAVKKKNGQALNCPYRGILLRPQTLDNGAIIALKLEIPDQFNVIRRNVQSLTRNIRIQQNAEERLRLAAKASYDLIYEWDVESGKLEWLGDIDQMLGYDPDQFPGTIEDFLPLVHPHDRKRMQNTFNVHMVSSEPIDEEFRIRRKDGLWLHLIIRGRPTLDYSGKPRKWIAVCSDISLIKETEAQLAKSQDKLRLSEIQLKTTFDNAPIGIVTMDQSGHFLSINPTFAHMLGYRQKELLKSTLQEITAPDDWDASDRKTKELWSGKISQLYLEKKYVCKDGSEIQGAVNASLVRTANGKPLFFVALIEDISKRKQMELQLEKYSRLKESLIAEGTLEDKAKLITDAVIDIFGSTFARLWIIREGDKCDAKCEYRFNEESGTTCSEKAKCLHLISSSGLYTHLDGKGHSRVPFGHFKIGQVASGEIPGFLTNDIAGDERIHHQKWAKKLKLTSFAGYRLTSDKGEPLGVIATFSKKIFTQKEESLLQNIAGSASQVFQVAMALEELKNHKNRLEEIVTERTAALTESEERLNLALEGANAGLWDYYTREARVYYGPRYYTMLGYEPNAFPHRLESWENLLHPKDKKKTLKLLQNFRSHGHPSFAAEFRMKTAGGNWRWILSRGKAVSWDEKGDILRMIGIHTDITDLKLGEEQLKMLVGDLEKANKELEDFAYIVSHDLKAPLRGISSLANWLKEDYSKQLDEKGHQYLDKLSLHTRWMHYLIEGILQYSKAGRGKVNRQPVDGDQLVHEVLEHLPVPREIRVNIHSPLPTIDYDKTHLFQIFQNLIGNAIKYMGKPEGQIDIFCKTNEDDFEFGIRDTGIGIEKRHFHRIFKMFQTLHPEKESDSTGIGLSLVKRIVEGNEGKVWVDSTVGQGSTFFFTVPKRTSYPSPLSRGNIEILIIDDNPEFIEVSSSMLLLEGYETHSAANGLEAIKILENNEREIHVVLMDVHIPGEEALDLFLKLKTLRPKMKVVACIDKEMPDTVAQLTEAGIDGLLQNPFKIHQLNSLLENVIHEV